MSAIITMHSSVNSSGLRALFRILINLNPIAIKTMLYSNRPTPRKDFIAAMGNFDMTSFALFPNPYYIYFGGRGGGGREGGRVS